MGAFERLKKNRLGMRQSRTPEPVQGAPGEEVEDASSQEEQPDSGSGGSGDEREPVTGEGRSVSRKASLTKWVEKRAHRVVSRIYDSRADDLEHRARRAVSSAYTEKADDLEDRAVRAMRRAIVDESERIKEAIEYGVAVKKREVRLSLIVLIVAALVYLGLYLIQQNGAA